MNADKMGIEDLLLDESFINYCKGSSPQDTAFWENHIKENPLNSELLARAKEKYILLLNALAHADLEEQVMLLKNSMEQQENATVVQLQQPAVSNKKRIMPLVIRFTAAAALVAATLFTINYFVTSKKNGKEFAAAYGERKDIQLPDGSVVTLNAGSNIRMNDKYGTNTREIYLEGEAFFEVKHDTIHPFIVHTQTMDVKALGTAFNVKAYPDEALSATTLIKGLVEVTLKEDHDLKMLLYPNQKIEWKHPAANTGSNNLAASKKAVAGVEPDSLKKDIMVTNTGDIKEIAWKNNKLIFDNERFEDIAALLERWYGATINFEDSAVRSYRYTGGFEKEDLKTVLDFLKESKNFSYTIEQDNTININLSK
jgi:transmembrane sensor